MEISTAIDRILKDWPSETQTTFRGNNLAEFIRKDLKESVQAVVHSVDSNLKVIASVGSGNWASVPWLAILDPNITRGAQHGVYPVYLFRADASGVYLTLGQGTADLTRNHGKAEAQRHFTETANFLRERIRPLQNWTGGPTDLRSETPLGRSYEAPNIGARLYEKGKLPGEDQLRNDLLEMLTIYKEVAKLWPIKLVQADPDISDFKNSLLRCGLRVSEALPTCIECALHAKPFLLLTGLSGSGKTQVALAFSKWICASDAQIALIAVGADWTSNENLLGFPDALNLGHYRKPDNGALDLILRAHQDPEHPYFLILDEMNLSHVERYFADFLSAMESGGAVSLHDDTGTDWDGVPAKLKIPGNLFVIGTVNVDETTYMFSPKVLDRANVIEFRVSDTEMSGFLTNPAKPDLALLAGKGASYSKAFVAAAKQRDVALDEDTREAVSKVLMEFFAPLQKAGAEFGYRTAHEICRFVYFYQQLAGDAFELDKALDAAIIQKLLPKLHGAKKKLGPVLDVLAGLCLNEAFRSRGVTAKPEELVKTNARYENALEKIARMQARLVEHGFASFAEA